MKKNFPAITYGMSVTDRESIISEWMKNPSEPLRIATMPPSQVKELQSKTSSLFFSPESLKKQMSHHPELMPSDYALAQDAVVRGQALRQNENSMAYALDEKKHCRCSQNNKSA